MAVASLRHCATARQAEALRLHEAGISVGEIAQQLGVCRARVYELVVRARQSRQRASVSNDRIETLSTRAYNCLRNAGFPSGSTRLDVGLRWNEIRSKKLRVRNLGVATVLEIDTWLNNVSRDDPIDMVGLA